MADKCRDCGAGFEYVPRKIYCQDCKVARNRATWRRCGKNKRTPVPETIICDQCGICVNWRKGKKYCKECSKERTRERDRKLKEKLRQDEYYREKQYEYIAEWREKYPEKRRAASNNWVKRKIKEDPLFCLQHRIRANINNGLRKNGFTKKARTIEILGCSWEHFKTHIERQFVPGMTWDNRDRWHIDHIVPLASAETEADVIALNHYTNLRPLWAEDNLAKRDQMVYLI